MKLTFVTTNNSKYEEVKVILAKYGVDTLWLKRKYEEDNEDDIEDVAKKAAKKLADEMKTPIVLEDTGLFFEAYNGFPGPAPKFVFKTIGYKGIFKLLDGESRKAYFKTVAAFCESGKEPITFSGEMHGTITQKIFNTDKDFDYMPYDRIYIPDGTDSTISDMTMEQKNALSQRGKAFRKLGEYLKENYGDR